MIVELVLAALVLFSASMWPVLFRLGKGAGIEIGARRQTSPFLRNRGQRLAMNGAIVSDSSALTHECGGLWGKWERKSIRVNRLPEIPRNTPRTAFSQAVADRTGAPKTLIDIDVQERECDQCGLVERREIR